MKSVVKLLNSKNTKAIPLLRVPNLVKTIMNKDRFKPLISLLIIFLVAPFLAALVSPWIYQVLQRVSTPDSVLDAPFYRVMSRVVLVMVALVLYPAYTLSGFKGRSDWGLPTCPGRWKKVGLGLGLGIVSMLVVYLLGVALGVFVWDTRGKPEAYIFRKVFQIILGGLFIGFFEEILFRGFIFNALRKSGGLILGILLSSFFFSIIHFMRPVDPEVMNRWYSGFLLFGDLFARAGRDFFQEAGTLFCMGVVLATLSYWMKSVYVAVGLHAGWVWVMMFFRLFTENQNNLVWLYGTNDWVSKAWMGPIMALTVLGVVALTRKKWMALGPFDPE